MTGRIVLATHNPHKVEEFAAIVAAVRPELEVVGYEGPEPVEDGVTFAQNALIKARTAAVHTGLPALAGLARPEPGCSSKRPDPAGFGIVCWLSRNQESACRLHHQARPHPR